MMHFSYNRTPWCLFPLSQGETINQIQKIRKPLVVLKALFNSNLLSSKSFFGCFQWHLLKFWMQAVVLAALLCCAQLLSHVWLFVTPWTAARWVLQSLEFSRQEYRHGLPFPPLGESFQPRDQTHVFCIDRKICPQYHIFSHGTSWN